MVPVLTPCYHLIHHHNHHRQDGRKLYTARFTCRTQLSWWWSSSSSDLPPPKIIANITTIFITFISITIIFTAIITTTIIFIITVSTVQKEEPLAFCSNISHYHHHHRDDHYLFTMTTTTIIIHYQHYHHHHCTDCAESIHPPPSPPQHHQITCMDEENSHIHKPYRWKQQTANYTLWSHLIDISLELGQLVSCRVVACGNPEQVAGQGRCRGDNAFWESSVGVILFSGIEVAGIIGLDLGWEVQATVIVSGDRKWKMMCRCVCVCVCVCVCECVCVCVCECECVCVCVCVCVGVCVCVCV